MNNLQTHITDFLRYLAVEKNASPLTIREYNRYLKEFSIWVIKNYPDFVIENLDLSIIRAFRVYLSERRNRRGGNLGKPTQNHYVICIRSFLAFLRKNDVKTLDPLKIEVATLHSRSLRFLDANDVIKLMAMPNIEIPEGLRDRTILELFFSTGLRVSELFRLNRDSVNLESREFSIKGKGGKNRLVFISDEATMWLQRYLEIRTDGFKPLFIRYSRDINTDDEKMRLSVSHIERMVKEYALYAGIKVRVTPHTLRHSFATNLLNNGANLIMVKEFLGHSSVATTEIYTHVTNDQLREAHKKFHGNNQ